MAGTEADPAANQREIVLRNGTRARVRPVVPADADLLRAALAELSPRSQQSRFLAPVSTLTDAQLRALVDVDGVNHVALGVSAPLDGPDERPIAVGRIIRYPDDPTTADLAITVADAWQRQGVGGALAQLLAENRPAGVQSIRTMILASNVAALNLAARMGRVTRTEAGGGALDIDIRPFT
jgi:RimJ/RimL family protein N-acetyltransferase